MVDPQVFTLSTALPSDQIIVRFTTSLAFNTSHFIADKTEPGPDMKHVGPGATAAVSRVPANIQVTCRVTEILQHKSQ